MILFLWARHPYRGTLHETLHPPLRGGWGEEKRGGGGGHENAKAWSNVSGMVVDEV